MVPFYLAIVNVASDALSTNVSSFARAPDFLVVFGDLIYSLSLEDLDEDVIEVRRIAWLMG